ncbi:MAG: MFS transporter [Planctomycetes bacterium]|nr:MFS transporter [Planctomycetota bacterium]
MLFRFSIYGFLKNQRYFEPFLLLVFIDKGLSFAAIGFLIAIRELTVNLLEIPSGAVADLWGRKKAMILAFVAYIVSFLLFAKADQFLFLAAAMFFYGVGEAFRTGTHKAIIFNWLELNNRTDERTKVYGYTRSWSKIGSALSVIIATLIVIFSDSYEYVFLIAIVPYLLAIINFLGYPSELDRLAQTIPSLKNVAKQTLGTLRETVKHTSLRKIIIEGMAFDGIFGTVKDYLQPILALAAVATAGKLFNSESLSETQHTAIYVGIAYFTLYLLSALASRNAHRVEALFGSDLRASQYFWAMGTVIFLTITIGAYYSATAFVIGAFILFHVLHNLWRPVFISRLAAQSTESQRATTLSIESLAKRITIVIAAPLLGWAIDETSKREIGGEFWPIGAVGLIVFLFFTLTSQRSKTTI